MPEEFEQLLFLLSERLRIDVCDLNPNNRQFEVHAKDVPANDITERTLDDVKRVFYADDASAGTGPVLTKEPWTNRMSACAIDATPPINPVFPCEGLANIPKAYKAKELPRRWDELVNFITIILHL